MNKFLHFIFFCLVSLTSFTQVKWKNVDSLYQPLPASIHIYFTDQPIDTSPFRAYYLVADLKDKKLEFTADTSSDRRLTPAKFYERNHNPLVVVNCTFFSYETNRSLNVVIKNGELLSWNRRIVKGRKDTNSLYRPYLSAIGISKNRKADIAWIKSDSTNGTTFAAQNPVLNGGLYFIQRRGSTESTVIDPNDFKIWDVQTAVGGGPVLLQKGHVKITNEEEMMFMGKAINDKHPRTAMGYTKNGKLIILMIEGRNKMAGGATLLQEAQIFKDLGCWEAINLDGGGSSCLLVNGRETIKVSDAVGQRPVPAVFIIRTK